MKRGRGGWVRTSMDDPALVDVFNGSADLFDEISSVPVINTDVREGGGLQVDQNKIRRIMRTYGS